MKKITIVLAAAFLLVSVLVKGQQPTNKTGTGKYLTTSGAAKTVNSSTDTAFMQWKQTESYKALGIVFAVIRGASTVTGKALVQVSNQVTPTNWVDYDTDTFSVSFSSGYKAKKWKYDNPSFQHWRVLWWQTAGTDTLKLDYFFDK